MADSLLVVPLKRTLHLDLTSLLSTAISTSSYQSANSFQDDIQLISHAREQATNIDQSQFISSSSSDSETLLTHLRTYYTYLESLESKFSDMILKSMWFQTLPGNKSMGQQFSSIKWEKLNILYNIAATLSIMATQCDITPKFQCLYFQRSASLFHYVALEQDEAMQVADKDTLLSLYYLMLAQAQECFWKAAKTSKTTTNKIVAKLVAQVGQYLNECSHYASSSLLIFYLNL